MKAVKTINNLPKKVKKQFKIAILLTCMVLTFIIPVFGGGYSVLKTEEITGSAAINDVDLLLVASSAFGEARKVMNATNPDAQEQFIKNINILVGGDSGWKWHNLGMFLGPKDVLSGTTWNVYQNPTTLSSSEIQNYNKDEKAKGLANAYKQYKAFGYAVQNLNTEAKKSHSSAQSMEEGLDSMSSAALKLGNFGVKFLNDYNPAPIVLSLYDSSNLSTYSDNKLIKIVSGNQIMKQIICLFGDKVGNTGLSFFIIINAIVAIFVFALSLFLTLFGNQSLGDGVRKFLIRIVIGTVGIYLIGNLMSVMLKHVSETILNVEAAEDVSYIENNLNVYDWYLTGFSLPDETELTISKDGLFQFNKDAISSINKYTYKRLTGKTGSAQQIKKRMENYTKDKNEVTASFVTPTYVSIVDADGSGEAWATDVFYKAMDNFANNKELGEGLDIPFTLYSSRYLWMSSLNMQENNGVWKVYMHSFSDNYYGLNPIASFNLLRTEFSGNNITVMNNVYPKLAYTAYDAVNVKDSSGDSSNMNSVLRFIAIFTIIMAALKGMITIFTAGFGGILSGGIKTATGSSYGLGQALGGVIAIFGGLIGISLILSVVMTLLNAVYGIAHELLSGSEIIDAILEPIEDAVGDIPFIGDLIMSACESIVGFLLTLIFSLTFPKLGGIPINVFCQYMADLPGKIAERAQMIEGMLLTGRSSAGHGLGRSGGGGGGRGAYGRMASAQASQAFGNAQRQAVGVVSGLAGAGAALAGMGLSAAGRAMNKKADGVEGKPNNPGLDNWDELSPEEQSAAAAAAADAGEDWDEMDQDAREKAMEERMAAEEAKAEAASAGAEGESVDGEGSEEDSIASELGENGEEGINIEEPGDASVSDGTEGLNEGAPGEVLNDQSLAGEDGESADVPEAEGSLGGDDVSDDSVDNYNNNQESLNAEQNVGNEIKADADARNVDNSTLTEEGDKDMDGEANKDGTTMAAANANINDKDAPGKGIGSADGISGEMSANVENKQTTDMKNNQTANIRAQQIDKSNATTMNKGTTNGTGQKAGSNAGATASQTTAGTGSHQGLNGTSKSAWGKDMSVRDQRKARIMHAVGDGLQMAGGNRTVGDGLKDAMGHMKDTAVSYTVSDDVLPTLTSSVRENRRRREARIRQRQNNGVNQ